MRLTLMCCPSRSERVPREVHGYLLRYELHWRWMDVSAYAPMHLNIDILILIGSAIGVYPVGLFGSNGPHPRPCLPHACLSCMELQASKVQT